MSDAVPDLHLADADVQALMRGELAPARQAAHLAHLDACDACLARAAALSAHAPTEAMRGGARGSAVASADVATAIEEAVDQPDEAMPRRRGERTEGGVYELTDLLAQGGMGRLFRAIDTVLARDVALKVPRTRDPLLLWRFEREAAITARLQHPSIPPILTAGRFADGAPFYVMPIIAGQPLERAMAGAVTMPERLRLLGSLIAVCDAVGYAHAQRVVHRDLKPNNILVGGHAQTYVLDWGLAKRLPEAQAPRTPRPPMRRRSWTSFGDTDAPSGMPDGGATRHGEVVGTPGFMAPEQARGEVIDERIDVYALGVMLAQLLTGRGPGKRQLAGLADAPPELAAIVARAMAPQRDDRYAHAGELADDLRQYQTGQLVAAYAYRPWDHVRRFLGKHKVAVAALGVALTATVAIAIAAFVRVSDARGRAEASAAEARHNRVAAEELAEYMLTDLGDRAAAIGRLDLTEGIGGRIDAYYRDRIRPTAGDPGALRWARALGEISGEARRRHDTAAARRTAAEALALARASLAATGTPAARLAVARALGDVALAAYDDPDPTTRGAPLAECVALLADAPDDDAQRHRAGCALLAAEQALLRGDAAAASASEALVGDALAAAARRRGAMPRTRQWLLLEVNHELNSAQLADLRGAPRDALARRQAATALLQGEVTRAPRDFGLIVQLADQLGDLAFAALQLGEAGVARDAYEAMPSLTARLRAIEPDDVHARLLDVSSLLGRARLAVGAEQLASATALYDAARVEIDLVTTLDPSNSEALMRRGGIYAEYAGTLWAQDQLAAADAAFGEAARTFEQVYRQRPEVAAGRNLLAATRSLAELATERATPDAAPRRARARALLDELRTAYPDQPAWTREADKLGALPP